MPSIGLNEINVQITADMAPSVRAQFEALQANLAGTVQQSRGAFTSFGYLDRVLGSHAATVLGLNSYYGMFGATLSRFAIGGAYTAVILGGIFAIAEAWKAAQDATIMTSDQFDKAAESFEKSTERMVKANKEGLIQLERNQGESLLRMANQRLALLTSQPFAPGEAPTFMAGVKSFWADLIGRPTVGSEEEITQVQDQIRTIQAGLDRTTLAAKEFGETQADAWEKARIKGEALVEEILQLNQLSDLAGIQLKLGLESLDTLLASNRFRTETANLILLPDGTVIDLTQLDKLAVQSAKAFGRVGIEMSHEVERQLATQQRQQEQQWINFGEHLGDAFINALDQAIRHGFSNVGSLLKSLLGTLVRIAAEFGLKMAIGAATGGAGEAAFLAPGEAASSATLAGEGAVVGAGAAAPDFSMFPPATNPLASARDADWQVFLRESNRIATRDGFR